MRKLIKCKGKRKRTIFKSKEQFTYNLRPGIPEFSNKTQELGEGLKAGKKESQAQK